ncbi:MAG: hypothetical protein ACOX8V_05450 [Thermoleophilia bacterium]|jgi:cell division protein FtsL
MVAATRSSWMATFEEGLQPSQAARRSAARTAARARRSTRYYAREATARQPKAIPKVESSNYRPTLKVVTRRRSRRGVVIIFFAVLILLLVVGLGVICPMLVSSAATGLESQTGRLQEQQEELAAAASALSAQVSALSAPERIAEQAAVLGLAPAVTVRYVDAEAGSVPMGGGAALEDDVTTIRR